MKEITSLTNSYIKELCELKKNSVKKEKQIFLVDGFDFIELAYSQNLLICLLTLEYDERFSSVEQIIVNKKIIDKLSNNVTSSSMIGVCRYRKNSNKLSGKLLYLDGVQDPGNVGTLIRTALAFNYNGIVLSSDSASIYNDKVISSSKGALFKIDIYDNVTLDELKELRFTLVATALDNSINYLEFTKKDNFVLILGNEGQGVKKENLEKADIIVKIPMNNIDSLNVAIAGGILMNEYR